MGWANLAPGTLLQPVRKGMGLKKGEKVVRLGGPIRVVSVEREELREMTENLDYGYDECAREGFPKLFPSGFVKMFCEHNACDHRSMVTRIEFEYVTPHQDGL